MNIYDTYKIKELKTKISNLEQEYNKIQKDNCHNISCYDLSCDRDCENCEINMTLGQLYGELLEAKEELKTKYNIDYDKLNKESNKKIIQQENINKDNELVEERKNKYLYLQADLDNIKKRYNKQLEDLKKYEGENIFKDLLEVFDNLDYSQMDDIDILNTYNTLLKIFNKYGIKLIYEDERPVFFNSEYDEAITSVPTNDPNLDNSINKVYKRGFFFKDKVLRFEKVIVNKYEA